jgi:hypothetical protein
MLALHKAIVPMADMPAPDLPSPILALDGGRVWPG